MSAVQGSFPKFGYPDILVGAITPTGARGLYTKWSFFFFSFLFFSVKIYSILQT